MLKKLFNFCSLSLIQSATAASKGVRTIRNTSEKKKSIAHLTIAGQPEIEPVLFFLGVWHHKIPEKHQFLCQKI